MTKRKPKGSFYLEEQSCQSGREAHKITSQAQFESENATGDWHFQFDPKTGQLIAYEKWERQAEETRTFYKIAEGLIKFIIVALVLCVIVFLLAAAFKLHDNGVF
jgi:hypothetical protein